MAEIPARVLRVIDGDTYVLQLNWERTAGWELTPREIVRLKDFDAAELSTVKGKAARDEARRTLPPGADVGAVTAGRDKYGRLLATVMTGGRSIGLHLAELGFGKTVKRETVL